MRKGNATVFLLNFTIVNDLSSFVRIRFDNKGLVW